MALAPAFSIGGVSWKDDEFKPENIGRASQRDGRPGRRSGGGE